MSTQELKAPTPIGGVVLDIDFVPSIVFAALYGCFLPFIIWRFVRADRRTVLQITTIVFAIERIVVYGLRASQAHGSDGRRAARGLLIYLQISFAQGYIGVLTDLLPLLRVLIVNATNGPDPIEPLAPPPAIGDSPEAKVREAKDDKRTRFITRFAFDPFSWLWFVPLALNITQGTRFPDVFKKQSTADLVFKLRYAGTAVSFFLTIIMLYWLVRMSRKLPDMNKKAAHTLLALTILLVIPSVYRLAVMHNTVPALIFTGSHSLTSTSEKALFYVFSEAPVWVATALLLVPNTRQVFRHGVLGDWRSLDGQKGWKESRKAAKEKKERERREREAAATSQV